MLTKNFIFFREKEKKKIKLKIYLITQMNEKKNKDEMISSKNREFSSFI
jgi:hypothetical protein